MSFDNNQQMINLIAEAAVTPFSIVKVGTGDKEVLLAGTNAQPLGISPDYAAVLDESVAIAVGGVAQVELGGTVLIGAAVKSDSAGFAVTAATTGTTIQNIVGTALHRSVSRLQPMFPPFPNSSSGRTPLTSRSGWCREMRSCNTSMVRATTIPDGVFH